MEYMASDAGLREFEKRLNYEFNDIGLLKLALTHSTYLNEKMENGITEDNERMEFLGDSILSAVITHLLITRYPQMDEGDLSKLRARLVSESALLSIAKELGVGEYIFLGRGEEMTGGRDKSSILADGFEAIVGAMYLDKGFDKTFEAVKGYFEKILNRFSDETLSQDYKTDLQEYVQGRLKTSPRYSLIDESGPEHDKTFIINVMIMDEVLGAGSGKSKKEAEQMAAKEAMEKIRRKE